MEMNYDAGYFLKMTQISQIEIQLFAKIEQKYSLMSKLPAYYSFHILIEFFKR